MPDRRIVGLPGVVEYLDTTERHIRQLVFSRRIPYLKVGGRLKFDLDKIDRWLDANAVDVAV